MWSQAKKPSHPRSSARAARRATTRGSASSPNSPISIARFTTAILTVHRELWLTVPRTDGRVIRWTPPPARGPRPPPWCTARRRPPPGPRPRPPAGASRSASPVGERGLQRVPCRARRKPVARSVEPAGLRIPQPGRARKLHRSLRSCAAAYSGASVPGSGRRGIRTCRYRPRRRSRQRQRPLPEEHDVFIDLGFQVPGRVWHVGEQLREPGPDAVLAALDPGGGDKDGIVGVVSDDLIQVARAERLDVVLEDFLRRACHFISFAASTLCLP